MNRDRWQRFQTLYCSVVDLPAQERTHFLKGVCSDDPKMRQELEAFLECEERMGAFLQKTAIEVLAETYGPAPSPPDADGTHDLIGAVIADRYVVKRYVGSGGMCHVYRADHRLLGTSVAIKRLRSEFRDKQEYRQQFIEEARRAVLLDHYNVA